MSPVALLALLALGGPAAAEPRGQFIMAYNAPIVAARLDPIVDPGKISGHVHTVVGASNFRESLNTPKEQQEAYCTSVNIKGDRSNYWIPTLYYIREDNTYEVMHGGSPRIYYFNIGPNVQPFPQGLRMVTGTAMSRDLSDPRTLGIDIVTQSGGKVTNSRWLPNATTHADGYEQVNTVQHFMSCGRADQALDSANHFDHMAWPVNADGKPDVMGDHCPESHPIRYPRIHYEVAWYPGPGQEIKPGRMYNVILSNGDVTGNSLHADFVAGWDVELLAQTIAQCAFPNGPDQDLKLCAPLKDEDQNNSDCRLQSMIPDEDVGMINPIKHLPGCNPVWTPEQGLKKPTECPWYTGDPGWVAPNVYAKNERLGGEVYPTALRTGGKPINEIKPTIGWDRPSIGAWGTDGNFYNSKVQKYDELLHSTDADITANLKLETAPNKHSRVFGMADDTRFAGLTPLCPPPTAYQTADVKMEEKSAADRLKTMAICGYTSQRDPPPRTGYVQGGTVQQPRRRAFWRRTPGGGK